MVSRRTILKSIGLVGLTTFTLKDGLPLALAQDSDLPPFPPRWQGQPLGRIASAYMNARDQPSTEGEIIKQMYQNDIVRVRRIVDGQTVYLHNGQWLETEHGHLYSSFVQPIWYHLPNPPVASLGVGRWGEITVPFTDATYVPGSTAAKDFKDTLYYSAIFRIMELVEGTDGKDWYQVKEVSPNDTYYVRATHVRLIPDADLSPLSMDVDPRNKKIRISISKQTLVAYENNLPVYSHRISTGLPDHGTPDGIYYIYDKRPGHRMVGGTAADEDDSEAYNLAGIPFTCYFTSSWIATHGTYWHNDYGIPRSHGCVNLPPYAARWIWRWSYPYPDINDYFHQSGYSEGTAVVVSS